jgi:hypothetical protein
LNQLRLELSCSSTKDEEGRKHAIFALSIGLGADITITFAQVRPYSGSTPTTPGQLLRFSLSRLPNVKDVPVVSEVHLPFDQLGVVWVNRELSAHEVGVLNKMFFQGAQNLLVKENKPNSKIKPSFAAGVHFQVQLCEQRMPKLVLDHIVGSKKKADNKTRGDEEISDHEDVPCTESDDRDDAGQSVAPLTKTIGPLSVRNIGFSVEGASFSKGNITRRRSATRPGGFRPVWFLVDD